MASRPAAAPDAPEEEGPINQAAADTPPTAIAATTAAGRMTPLRRIKRLVGRALRAPVRCRDKAILSSAKRTERGVRAHRPLRLHMAANLWLTPSPTVIVTKCD